MKTSGTLQEVIKKFHESHEKVKQAFENPKVTDLEYGMAYLNCAHTLCDVIACVFENSQNVNGND